MTKTVLAILMLAAATVNGGAAVAAASIQPTPEPRAGERLGPVEGIPTTPIPACWIVPVSCR